MNKKMKKVVTLFISGVIMVSSFVPVFADEKKSAIEEYPTFKEYIQEVKDIKNDDLKKLENLYNEAISFEKQEKFTDADKKWDTFDGILEKYEDIIFYEGKLEDLSFDDFCKDFKDLKIKKDDLNKLKDLYNKTISLEKNKKFTDAEKCWDDFYNILDKYLPTETCATADEK